MSHIVLLSSIYLGKASTNGLCAHNIVDALNRMGHEVDVVCYEDTSVFAAQKVFTIKCDEQPHQPLIIRVRNKVVKALDLLTSNPRCFLRQDKANRYYEELVKIGISTRIDAVVAMFFPLETAEAISMYKKKHPNVKAIVYELDSIIDGIAQGELLNKPLKRVYLKWLSSVYENVDNVIVMKGHYGFWEETFGSLYRKKVLEADIPVLLSCNCQRTENMKITFIYAGLLDKRYRSPEYLLSVLKELGSMIDYAFFFYTKGDCEDMIAKASRIIPGVEQKGYVTQAELDQAICNASILVSLGNSISNSVPSKLISYISYKKPIIHFSSQNNDICRRYLEAYPLSLVLNQKDPPKESCKRIISFISSVPSVDTDCLDVDSLFKMNTPQYSAGIINEIIAQEGQDGKC